MCHFYRIIKNSNVLNYKIKDLKSIFDSYIILRMQTIYKKGENQYDVYNKLSAV